jgi:nitrilase
VICAAGINRKTDYPEPWRKLAWLEGNGGSCIIDPRGEIIAGPVVGEETILYAEGSLQAVRAAKSACDIAGHYSRPDIFSFKVLKA